MIDEIEPLSAALWFRRIDMIGRGELGGIESSLRHAGHLLQLTPQPFRHVVRLTVDEEIFEALLEAGQYDAAARHLVAQPTALSVDEIPGVPVRATISCAILGRAVRGKGDSVAAAILVAWTTCLLALRAEYGGDLLSLASQAPHRGQSERHRQSS